ncbi:lipase family protein [Nocardia sp. NPDC048505]|uniref:lipase family protein n=1 Tax=Nocardia sp. NPDC048505 TaxID=3155756 RepID=UPI003408DACD
MSSTSHIPGRSPRPRGRRALAAIGAACLVAAGSLAATSPAFAQPADPVEPAPPADAFYDRPANLADVAPGTVLRSRPVQAKALQLLPINTEAWQLLYRTSDAQGRPDATVTTVLVPREATSTKLLSFQAATDSTLRICNPSFSLVNGGPIDFGSVSGPVTFGLPGAEVLLAAAGLAQGWTVAIPDHGGLDARFLTPRQPGYAVLDGIRAVRSFQPARTAPEAPVSLWGYSGGAIATSWAIEEQPSYAPELPIVGAAIGAPERDLEASLRSANTAALAGLIPIALAAIGKDSPDFAAALDRFVTEEGRARVAETRNHCVAQNVLANVWFDYRDYLTAPLETVLADPVIAAAITERGISGRAPSVPTYVYNGITEEVAPISGTDKLAQSYCAAGASVTYRREELPPEVPKQVFTTHGTVAVAGAPGAFAWLRGRMNGEAAPAGCDIRTVANTAFEPGALRELGPSFLVTPLALLIGAPVGAN